MAKGIQGKTALALILFSISAHAVDYDKTQQQADRYMREIREREDRNREKYNDLERRANEREIIRELREQQWQHEFDRMIDENR